MFTKFIETYGSIDNKKVIPLDDLERIIGIIPPELSELLLEGEGSYMNGFLWIVNPSEYKDLINVAYDPISLPAVCFARDAFGSFYIWEDNSIICVNINSSKQEVVGARINVFFGSFALQIF